MTSMSVVGAYAPGVLHGLERHSATAASDGSSSSSSPPWAHGAVMLGLNLNPGSAVVADAGHAATAATAPATDTAPTTAMPQRKVRRTFPPELGISAPRPTLPTVRDRYNRWARQGIPPCKSSRESPG